MTILDDDLEYRRNYSPEIDKSYTGSSYQQLRQAPQQSPKHYGGNESASSMKQKPVQRQTIHPEVQKWFSSPDTKASGRITAKELQAAFETFQGKHFSDGACKFVVRLFDLDKNGGLDVREFEQLYSYVKEWVNAFNSYDRERSGFLDETELDYALKQLDINFSPEFIKFLITRSDPNARKMSLDQFIVTCVQIQRFTTEFKARDENFAGSITVRYEDFLEMILRWVSV